MATLRSSQPTQFTVYYNADYVIEVLRRTQAQIGSGYEAYEGKGEEEREHIPSQRHTPPPPR